MKKFKTNSFAGRLTGHIMLVWLTLMTLLSAFILAVAMRGMLTLSKIHYDDILALSNETLQTILRSVEVSVVNNVAEVERNLSSPEAIYDALERELGNNTHIAGLGAIFIPDYFPQEGYWAELYVTENQDGTISKMQIGSETHDYFHTSWYEPALRREEGFWSDPYYDNVGAKAMLCTFFMPIHDASGTTVGTVGADIPIDWLSDHIRNMDEMINERFMFDRFAKKDAYSFILSRDGQYITHPDKARALKKSFFDYFQSSNSDYENVGEEMIAGHRGEDVIKIEGVRSYVVFSPIERTGWSYAIVVPVATLARPGLITGLIILALLALGALIGTHVSRVHIKRLASPLKHLANATEEVAKGNFEASLPEIESEDEIRHLRDAFANMQMSLSEYVRQLTTATAREASMKNELKIARSIQMSMLPDLSRSYPVREDIDIFGSLTPAKAVGGDIYDFYVKDGRLYFCIGDVAGKGVPASLVMAVISALFRSLSASEEAPDRVVRAINESLYDRSESMMFVTFFFGILDLSTGMLRYCNAGHNVPILVGKVPSFIEAIPNIALGVERDFRFTAQSMNLKPGSSLFLYTDGLTEAENTVHDQFGENRVMDILSNAGTTAPDTLVAKMETAVKEFVQDAEQSDDLTLLAIRRPAK